MARQPEKFYGFAVLRSGDALEEHAAFTLHKLASMFPSMTAEEEAGLQASISKHGVQQPIVVWHDQIIDGRHRGLLARKLGLPCPFVVIEAEEEQLAGLVTSLNFQRRNLSPGQRAAVGAIIFESFAKNRGDYRDAITSAMGVSDRYARTAYKVAEHDTGLLQKVINGELALYKALAIIEKKKDVPTPEPGDGSGDGDGDWEDPEAAEGGEPNGFPKFDELGHELPDQCVPAFDAASGFDDLISECNALRKKIDAASEGPAGTWLAMSMAGIEIDLKNVITAIRKAKPHIVCTKCHGHKQGGCKACRGSGWFSKGVYDALPSDEREKIEKAA